MLNNHLERVSLLSFHLRVWKNFPIDMECLLIAKTKCIQEETHLHGSVADVFRVNPNGEGAPAEDSPKQCQARIHNSFNLNLNHDSTKLYRAVQMQIQDKHIFFLDLD